MKFRVLLPIVLLASTAGAMDHPKNYEKGTLVEMTSVECGVDENSGKSFAGTVLGTDAAHKKTKEMLCQEYLLRSNRVLYRIRPRDDKHPVLLPIGESAQFRIKKDRLLLRVPESDDKEREYTVVSMQQTASAAEQDIRRADASGNK